MSYQESLRRQLEQLDAIFKQSVADAEVHAGLGKSLAAIASLEVILNSVSDRKEYEVYVLALQELQYSLLSVSVGNYRHAYGSLRLFFELALAGVEFSVNDRYFRGWRAGKDDIFWSRLSDPENGVLSKNFCNLYFPELGDHVSTFRNMAAAVYRECSEFVHGNPLASAKLPVKLSFKRELPLEWASKFDSMHLIVVFLFSMRYLKELPDVSKEKIKDHLLQQVGHLEQIRGLLGGAVGA